MSPSDRETEFCEFSPHPTSRRRPLRFVCTETVPRRPLPNRIPIPQYPLYTATLASQEAVALNYYLNEEKNWAYDEDSVLKALDQAKKDNVPVKAVSRSCRSNRPLSEPSD